VLDNVQQATRVLPQVGLDIKFSASFHYQSSVIGWTLILNRLRATLKSAAGSVWRFQ